MINASKGRRKEISFRFMINPENNAMAITGENPDQLRSGPKKYLQIVARPINMMVKRMNFPLIFIIGYLR
jgi:hypothetical protein